jgi:hypothetical protein
MFPPVAAKALEFAQGAGGLACAEPALGAQDLEGIFGLKVFH